MEREGREKGEGREREGRGKGGEEEGEVCIPSSERERKEGRRKESLETECLIFRHFLLNHPSAACNETFHMYAENSPITHLM